MEKMSSSKRTNHIKVILLFIKDIIEHADLYVDYCPAKKFWAYILTKPLKGNVFKEIRAILMHCAVDYIDFCTKDVEKIAGLSKPDYLPIPSL